MKTFLAALAVVLLAGCGGGSSGGSNTTTEQSEFATPSEVAAMIESKDLGAQAVPESYTFSCVSEDAEGRKFRCLKNFGPADHQVAIASYDVVCDVASCQWEEFPY